MIQARYIHGKPVNDTEPSGNSPKVIDLNLVEIVKLIKDSKKKVQASIQGDLVRVAGKDRDALQEVMALLRGADFGIDMQFTNYRSN